LPPVNPFLAVGAYEISSKSPTAGYSIIFDTTSSGAAYPATGTGGTPNGAVSLAAPFSLDMQGINFTSKAIPVTMGSVAYILDEVQSQTICPYISSSMKIFIPPTNHVMKYHITNRRQTAPSSRTLSPPALPAS